MFRKRRLTNSGATVSNLDPSRCEWVQLSPSGQLIDGSATRSKKAEDCGWGEDTPRHCERILRLLPIPKVRFGLCECAHQALRGMYLSSG